MSKMVILDRNINSGGIANKMVSIYGNQDPLSIGVYGITEAASYLSMPLATLRTWIHGRIYPTEEGRKFFEPLINIPDESAPLLSFRNLVEGHVLRAIRAHHNVSMPNIRIALDYLREKYQSEHPLTDERLETDGVDLFVRKFGQIINLSQKGQLAMKAMLGTYLKRIDRDISGVAIRLYPFTRDNVQKAPKMIAIDPYMSFGKPVIFGTGIKTSVLAERFEAGESIRTLTKDYGLRSLQIEEAIRYELDRAA